MQGINFCFSFLQQQKAEERTKICTKEVCDHQKEGEGRRWTIEIYQLKIVFLLRNSFAQRQFLIGQFSYTCQPWAKRLHFPIAGKEWWSTLLKMKFLIFSLHTTTPCIYKGWFFFFWGGMGAGDSWTQARSSFQEFIVTCCLSCITSGAKRCTFQTTGVSPINSLQANISMHILHTVPYTFPKRLTSRICLTVKTCFSYWSSPLFSWLLRLIQGWYSKEKLDASHSYGLKG